MESPHKKHYTQNIRKIHSHPNKRLEKKVKIKKSSQIFSALLLKKLYLLIQFIKVNFTIFRNTYGIELDTITLYYTAI